MELAPPQVSLHVETFQLQVLAEKNHEIFFSESLTKHAHEDFVTAARGEQIKLRV